MTKKNKEGSNRENRFKNKNKKINSNNQARRKVGVILYGKCRGCRKNGHHKAKCWKDQKYTSKRPNNYISGEKVMSESDQRKFKSVEFMLMNVNMATMLVG